MKTRKYPRSSAFISGPLLITVAVYVRHLAMPETTGQVVVHHPHRLHEGITDGRPYKLEASPYEFFAHSVRFGSARGNLFGSRPSIHDRRAPHKAPYECIEASEFLLDRPEGLGVLNRSRDFEPVSHDPRVGQPPRNLLRIAARHLAGIE